jgi:outer membrane protein OmpA-like peptidoglycan-associated protein
MKKSLSSLIIILLVAPVATSQFWNISEPTPLKGQVNSTEAEESAPVLSPDGKTLYFVRTFDSRSTGGKEDQDIWSSSLDGEHFSSPVPLKELNNTYHNAVIGAGANSLYVLDAYEGKKDFLKGLSISAKNGQYWQKPEKINIPGLDVEGDFYTYFISKNQQVILISYRGPNSIGEEDLFVSLNTNGSWSTPLHMGSTINSSGFEISPFMNDAMDTLYFSSNGLGGQGDADIFYSVKNGSNWTEWTSPTNLGPKINSTKFDAYFILRDNQLYWSSNRSSELSDIYTATVVYPPLLSLSCEGKDVSVYNGNDGMLLASIEGGVPPLQYEWSNTVTEKDQSGVRKGEYSMTVTDSIGQIATCLVAINQPPPPPIELDKPFHLPEIRYVFNQWAFVNDQTITSTDSLMYVFEILNDHPTFVLELSSHTDCRGKPELNQKLSENRARACYKYLVEVKGIDPRRIVPVGKGEIEPRTVYKQGNEYLGIKPTDMSNVETVILTEAYINQYKDSNSTLYKWLHQLNRRTEVRVISKSYDPATYPAANPDYLKYVAYP